MISSQVTCSKFRDPRTILNLGLGNAIFLAMFLHITALLCGAEIRGAALVGISTYAFYMLNQHRRVFVLGLAPDLICFFRYCTSAEDFLKWVQEAELTLPEMERSFWENFWAPYTIGAATAVFLVLATT